jgi:hypothetical protein
MRRETFDRRQGDAFVMLRDDHVLGGGRVVRKIGDLFSELFPAVPGKPTVITRKAVQPRANRPGHVIVRELPPHGKQHVLRDIRKISRSNAVRFQNLRHETGLRPADGRE